MKKYTIKDAAEIMNVPTSTIRYYDKEGLLPFVERLESGYRVFSENDLGMMRTIDCLKKTGMSIKDIRQYVDLTQRGDDTLEARYQMFLERRQTVEAQIKKLKQTLDMVQMKCRYYEIAIEEGSEKVARKRIQAEYGTCKEDE